MFHEMTLKLYFMKCLERKFSQRILPLIYSKSRNKQGAGAGGWLELSGWGWNFSNFLINAGGDAAITK